MSLEMQEQFNASLLGDLTPEEAARTLKKNLDPEEEPREPHSTRPGIPAVDETEGGRECGSAS